MMTPAVYRNLLHEMLLRQGKRVEIWESSGRMNWKLVKQVWDFLLFSPFFFKKY